VTRSLHLGLVLALVLAAGAASGDPLVYYSPGDSGFKPAQAMRIPKGKSVPLYLWIDPGSQAPSGTVCNNATGDASCAYDLRIQATGTSTLSSFVPTGGACDVGCKLTSSMLRVNRILTSAPLVGKQRLGVLTVNTASSLGSGQVEVTGVHSVGAARQLQPISNNTIATVPVPEPGMLVLLFSGLAGLAVLHRLSPRRNR
jgi:hypothetical protein